MNTWIEWRSAYRRFLAEGRLDSARDCLQKSINIVTAPNMSELPTMYNMLAKLNLQINNLGAAEIAVRKAIETEAKFGSPPLESDHSAAHHVMLADVLRRQCKYTEALKSINQGIALYSQHLKQGDDLIKNLKSLKESIEAEKWKEV